IRPLTYKTDKPSSTTRSILQAIVRRSLKGKPHAAANCKKTHSRNVTCIDGQPDKVANVANVANFAILASPQRNLNWLLRILRALIRDSSVEAGMLSFAAAPDGPATRPRLSAKATSIISRSSRGSSSIDTDEVTRVVG